jgi:alkaline phosphatase
MTIGAHPDFYQTYRPKLDAPFVPAIKSKDAGNAEVYVANPMYKDVPGAVFTEGTLPRKDAQGVHAVDDVILSAAGPGADQFKGFMENTDVFKVMVKALALGDK